MTDIELVIKIPEEYYKAIMKIPASQSTADMLIIKNGIPLENQKTGHWDDSCPMVSDGSLWKSWVCSKCDNRVMVKTLYCSYCGAKMEGEKE